MYIILIEQMMNVLSHERFTFTYCGSSVALINKLKSIATWFEFFVYAIWDKEKCIILIDVSNVHVGRWKLIKLFGFCTVHEDIWSTRDGHATEWKKQQNKEFCNL
jgi:hypothetical protein